MKLHSGDYIEHAINACGFIHNCEKDGRKADKHTSPGMRLKVKSVKHAVFYTFGMYLSFCAL